MRNSAMYPLPSSYGAGQETAHGRGLPKVALVHDWVLSVGGAERALMALREAFPNSDLFTLFYSRETLTRLGFDEDRVRASFLARVPALPRLYTALLPLYPVAIEGLDVSQYDIVLSSSHSVAHGVLTHPHQIHVCYCHTPMRYAWHMTHQYLRSHRLDRGFRGLAAQMTLHYLRMWDYAAAQRVDHFLANSRATAQRIGRFYGRSAEVVHGPVDTGQFGISSAKDDFFLIVSRLVSYKRTDLAVQAFSRLGLPLVVVGDGPEYRHCRRLAAPNIKFMGRVEDSEARRLMSRARALIFPANEDLGLVPIEAQASGTPVVAYASGGVLDTVVPYDGQNWDQATGAFFREQSVDSLAEAVKEFINNEHMFQAPVLLANARRFDKSQFIERMRTSVLEAYRSGEFVRQHKGARAWVDR